MASRVRSAPKTTAIGTGTASAALTGDSARTMTEARKTAMAIKAPQALASADTDVTQLVTFLLKDEEFGFDIMSVQEIIRLPKMAKLPHTPDYVEGVSNLRGVVLPIFDIRARFGMKREEPTDRSRVLVIDIEGKRTGLLVDGVREVTRVGRNEFEAPPAAIRNETADYIDGVVKLDQGSRIIIVLDARRVCAFGEDQTHDVKAGHAGRKILTPNSATQAAADGHTDSGRKQADVQQLVSFQVGQEEFAFQMGHVREILRVQTPKEVPGAPSHLLGVLTVRGKILPIVDLRRLLRQNSFAGDQVAACIQASAGYRAWLHQTDAAVRSHELAKMIAATGLFRQWLNIFNSSSRTLTETLAKMRTLNEHISKQVTSVVANEPDNHDPSHKDILQSSQAMLDLMQMFEAQVEGNIREDQRIIVVDSNGFQLGLVVDHVNEVLHVPDDAIESPPSIADQDGVGLSGIAKLEDGNRLILLLATSNLLDREKIEELRSTSTFAEEPARTTSADTDTKLPHKDEETKGSAKDTTDLQLVTFLLGKEEYGIPIAKIQEIDRLSNITQTPKAPRFVEGVTNLRGEVIPVLSTRALFALEPKPSDDRTRVIIVDLGGAKTGLIVDSVKEVLSIASSNIAPPPTSISEGAEGQFISGIGKVGDGKRMIVLLDVGRVLSHGEQKELAAFEHTA